MQVQDVYVTVIIIIIITIIIIIIIITIIIIIIMIIIIIINIIIFCGRCCASCCSISLTRYMQSFVSLYLAGWHTVQAVVAGVITLGCVQLKLRLGQYPCTDIGATELFIHMLMPLQEMVLFLQKLPTSEWNEIDIEMVFSRAYMLRASFNDARSHLQS